MYSKGQTFATLTEKKKGEERRNTSSVGRMLEYKLLLRRTRTFLKRMTLRLPKSVNKMLLLYSSLFVILSLCTCPVTSLRACGGELTNLLMEHCGEMKRVDLPPVKRIGSDDQGFESNELAEQNGYSDVFQKVLISKLQELIDEWRKRHSYEVNVRGLRIRRRRRAVTVSGFLDQCCQSGCRLSDLVSVGFC